MRVFLFLTSALCCLSLCVSCKTLKPDSAGTMVESYRGTKITQNSKIFDDWFNVIESVAAKRDSGLMNAQVSLQNLKGDCQFEYRFRWLDKNGIEVRTPTSIWMQRSSGAREMS